MNAQTTQEIIDFLEGRIPDSTKGLPEDIFLFISRTTPLINVDLLVKDENGRTLLAWRDDPIHGKGWHVPGGIVRFKETLEQRLRKVAETEIRIPMDFDPTPAAIHEIISPSRKTRGHFISLLYRGRLSRGFTPKNVNLSVRDNGYLQWHEECPEEMLKAHEIYRSYIGSPNEEDSLRSDAKKFPQAKQPPKIL